ncbi:MAG: hypothetical protein HYT27_01735 [Parcubacteria group bacterium]|nr:hypothetical protein [Parcubacteria group bacterium]
MVRKFQLSSHLARDCEEAAHLAPVAFFFDSGTLIESCLWQETLKMKFWIGIAMLVVAIIFVCSVPVEPLPTDMFRIVLHLTGYVLFLFGGSHLCLSSDESHA